ncbi:MAG: peptidase domain-containing ABC transporter [Steroidobacteraceae bacterium]|jgi:ATP-binding cassette subfamily B protein
MQEKQVAEASGAVQPVKSAPTRKFSALAALAALATRLGVEATVDELRRRFSVGEGEPDTDTLLAIARELGLQAKSLQMTFAELPRLTKTLPAILRAKDGGALVLEDARSDPMKGSVAVIRDPTAPEAELVAIEEIRLAEFWEGEVILLKRSFAAADDQQPFGMAWLAAQILRESKLFRDIGWGALASTVFAIAPPFMFMIVIDRVLINNSFQTLNVLVGAILIVIAAETVITHLRHILTQVASTRLDGRLNLYIVDKLLKLPMDFFETNPTGRSMTRINQSWKIRSFFTGQLFGAFMEAVPLVGLIPAMIILEWHLALLAFTLAGLIFLVVLYYLGPLARANKRVVLSEQAKNAHLVETLYGMKTIKSLALEGRRRKEWDVHVAETTAARHALGLLAAHPASITLPLQRLIYAGCYAIGAYMVLFANTASLPGTPGGSGASTTLLGTTITAGTLVAFAMLSLRLSSPLVVIATLQLDLAEVRGAIGQLSSILNAAPEVVRANGLRLPITGEIVFKDLRFRYAPDAPYALDQVSFTVPRGTMLGIMGRSGSGKTTVTRLLQRLHSSYDGMIKIDGMDLREMDLMHLRTHIGVVPQENFLFSGSVRDNIAMARPDATFLDVVRAAQLSGAEEFIERMPRGYDTLLEEGATNLSGGQRQRLAIARALLVDPPVLILDEATSALDAESEAIVNANLKRMCKGRTVISISHRLSMLVEADAILVLERGKVYDIGTHEELLRRCDIYKHMWYQQNRHSAPRPPDPLAAITQGVV